VSATCGIRLTTHRAQVLSSPLADTLADAVVTSQLIWHDGVPYLGARTSAADVQACLAHRAALANSAAVPANAGVADVSAAQLHDGAPAPANASLPPSTQTANIAPNINVTFILYKQSYELAKLYNAVQEQGGWPAVSCC
jgi:hypothetical protein